MKTDNKYISYLDGMRGFAILFVLLAHFNLGMMSLAQFGVTVFFFVSGFLITKLLIHEFQKKGGIQIRDFYLRRIFRLYPALIFMLFVSSIAMMIYGYQIIWGDILAGLLYYTNYYLIYFTPQLPDSNYLLVSKILWSLSVEEHFYLIFPLVFAATYVNPRRLLTVLVVLLFVFLLIRVFSDRSEVIKNYYVTHSRADSILYGCVSALLIYHFKSSWYLQILQSRYSVYVGILVLGLVLLIRSVIFQGVFAYSLQGLALCVVVPWFAFADQKHFLYRVVDNRLAIMVGKLSYSLYLFHWVALKIGHLLWEEKNLAWYCFVIPCTVILSVFSYYVIETPFIALRKRFGSNVIPTGMASA